mmetsp:Transcript_13335/g.42014  ORF Transcript_13335/g.42014 Transcript_13335/m.42014 type:complete len:381 (+) Transcript_13335:815-1957(+)
MPTRSRRIPRVVKGYHVVGQRGHRCRCRVGAGPIVLLQNLGAGKAGIVLGRFELKGHAEDLRRELTDEKVRAGEHRHVRQQADGSVPRLAPHLLLLECARRDTLVLPVGKLVASPVPLDQRCALRAPLGPKFCNHARVVGRHKDVARLRRRLNASHLRAPLTHVVHVPFQRDERSLLAMVCSPHVKANDARPRVVERRRLENLVNLCFHAIVGRGEVAKDRPDDERRIVRMCTVQQMSVRGGNVRLKEGHAYPWPVRRRVRHKVGGQTFRPQKLAQDCVPRPVRPANHGRGQRRAGRHAATRRLPRKEAGPVVAVAASLVLPRGTVHQNGAIVGPTNDEAVHQLMQATASATVQPRLTRERATAALASLQTEKVVERRAG